MDERIKTWFRYIIMRAIESWAFNKTVAIMKIKTIDKKFVVAGRE